jgi:dihydrofolate synthase/folylpolyglutamate synthase
LTIAEEMDFLMGTSRDKTYQETIDYLFGLQKHGIKFGLTNSFSLMDVLGRPHKKFRSVHIAGTNGKGSTAAFLSSILQAAGFRVGLYTSPHLVHFTERIRINNVQIAEERVVDLAQKVRQAGRLIEPDAGEDRFSPTFFEVTTAMAFAYFAEEDVDIAVIEAGMGGRLDSTNVITPLVSIITNIDLEHTEFLGNTLEQIAGEKAGIIKEGVPVVTGATQPGVIEVLERESAAKRTLLYRISKDFRPERIIIGPPQVFDYQGISGVFPSLRIQMLGRHQIDNAALALAAAECLRNAGIAIDEPALRRGLGQTFWEGRMERVSERPDIYLDGAHNPASARVLARSVAAMKPAYRKLVLIIGILADKDYRKIIAELVPLADHVVVTRPQYSRAMDLPTLASEIKARHGSVEIADSVEEAIRAAGKAASDDDLILITGSLYIVGDARAALVRDAHRPQALNGLKG